MIPILLLAAGTSSRMQGSDKLMEEVDGMPLLRRQAMRACATGAPVIVALPSQPHPRYGALEGLDIVRVPVPNAQDGMNASMTAGLEAVPTDTDAVMILLADMPDITQDDMSYVLQSVDLKSPHMIWRATTQNGDAGHPIVFHARLIPELSALRGDQGGSAVVRAHAQQTSLIPLPDTRARTDLDTPEAWAEWRAKQGS